MQQRSSTYVFTSPFWGRRPHAVLSAFSVVFAIMVTLALTGCGSGGYAGATLGSVSRSAVTLDAGQSITVNAADAANLPVNWTMSGGSCTGASCGSLSSTTAASTTYTAPAGLTAPESLTLAVGVTGTRNAQTIAVTVNPDPVISGNPPAGTVGTPYTATLTISGGTAPLTLSAVGGTLPAGLSFNAATGVISGTPTASGTFNLALRLTDSSDVPNAVTASEQIVISAASTGTGGGTTGSTLAITGATLPGGTVGTAYSTTLQATGGTAPYTWSVTSGALPAGLTLAPATGVISGTPTAAGTLPFTAQVQDSTGAVATQAFSITIAPAGPTTGGGTTLTLTTGTLPNGTVNVPYTGTVGVGGGTAPYTCTLSAGNLPAGLTLGSNCVVSGTPTTAGTATVTVAATDAASPVDTGSGTVTLTINPAATLVLTSPPAATVGTPYLGTIGVTGGTAPYTCTLVSGTLPAGLTLGANCMVSGTPTTAGTTPITVKATDSANPANTTTGAVTLTVNTPALVLTTGALPGGTVGVAYNSTLPVTGGAAPYSCTITSGTLPAGLTAGANCSVTGTPTAAGTANLTVKVTDAANPVDSTTGIVSLTIAPAPLSITSGNLPNGTVGVPYSNTIPVTGGTAPYSCTVTSGTLPAGLTAGANCLVSGTPTVAGTVTLGVRASDSANPAATANGTETLTIAPATVLTLSSPPAATAGTPYTSTIGVTGGTGPYTCTITAGTLPAGLTLGTHCALAGTATTAGSATVTVQATDASSPANSTTGPVTVTVNAALATLTLGAPPAATISTPYTGTIPVTGGTAPYTCTVASGTLPAGLALGAGCQITGTPTATGSSTVQVTATDAATPADTTTGPVTVTVNPLAPLTLTGALPNATVGVAYTQTLAATGGLAPYTYALTAGALPAGLTLSSTGTISGTPTTAGAASFTVTATDAEGTPQTASLPLVLLVTYPTTATDAELKGPYAFLFQGYDDVVAGVLAYQTATVGSFTADGTGVVSAGELDTNHQGSTATGNTLASHAFLGTYTLGTDGRGFLTLSQLQADGTVGQTNTYALAVKAPTAPATVSAQASLIEYDGNQLAGTRGSGTVLLQDTTAFSNGLNGSYAFGLQGDTPCLVSCGLNLSLFGPVAEVGQMTATAGAVTGTADANIAAGNFPSEALSGGYGSTDGNGRLALSMTTNTVTPGTYPTDYAVYVVNANQAFLMSTDKHSAFVLLAGQMQLQTQATFTNAAASGPYVGYENSPTNPGLVGQTLQNVLNLSTATIFQGSGNGTGTCTTDVVTEAGLTGLVNTLTGLGGLLPIATVQQLLGDFNYTGTSGCTVATNGREVLTYVTPYITLPIVGNVPTGDAAPAPRVVYLYGPNQGFFLETSYAALGHLEQQTGAPFSLATLHGTYVYGSTPASSLASTNASGVFTADGNGTATATLDENVGVGTLNVLELGTAGTFPYALTNGANGPTWGTYQLGTTQVIYAISPTRFAVVDTNATTTSPTVALTY